MLQPDLHDLQVNSGTDLSRIQAEGAAEVGADVAEVGGGKGSDKGALNLTLIEENCVVSLFPE